MEIIQLTKKCPACGVFSVVSVKSEAYGEWLEGDLGGRPIQEIFPELDIHDREVIKTGICITCWDEMFPDTV